MGYKMPREIIDISTDFRLAIGYREGKPISYLLKWDEEKYCSNGDEVYLDDKKYRVVDNLWYIIVK